MLYGKKILMVLFAIVVSAFLSACGGGGGGGGGSSSSVEPSDSFISIEPVANAGRDQYVKVGDTVLLDGSGSLSPSGGTLTYAWQFITRPVGSSAGLVNADAVNATFVADVRGDYQLILVVDDGFMTDESSPVIINATTADQNAPPQAKAGITFLGPAAVGDIVTLDGSGSTDADGNPLSYSWIFNARPTGSSAVLSGADGVNPTFTPDRAGVYELVLTVSDGLLSDSDTLLVEGSYAPLFFIDGVISSVTDASGNFYVKDTSITATITNNSLMNFALSKAELYSKSSLLVSVPINKILFPGAQETGSFTLKEGDAVEVDGVEFWYYLEHSTTLEKIIIKLLYVN